MACWCTLHSFPVFHAQKWGERACKVGTNHDWGLYSHAVYYYVYKKIWERWFKTLKSIFLFLSLSFSLPFLFMYRK